MILLTSGPFIHNEPTLLLSSLRIGIFVYMARSKCGCSLMLGADFCYFCEAQMSIWILFGLSSHLGGVVSVYRLERGREGEDI